MSRFPTREQVLEAIEERAPERLRHVLADNLRPAIAITARPIEDSSLAIGASKIGGAPDVPRDFEWPQWKGKPLGFVAQFNLEEVAAFDVEHALPESGTLSFFYAIEEQAQGYAGGYEAEDVGAWRVFFWPREVELELKDLPFEASPRNSLPLLALDLGLEWHISSFAPGYYSNASGQERAQIGRLRERLEAGRRGLPLHRLLGEADAIQNPPEVDLHEMFEGRNRDEDDEEEEDPTEYYERLLSDGLGWRLLLQIDSDAWQGKQAPRWMWGDAGMIYFCLHRDDLAARRFDRAWLQLQCY